MEKLLFDFSLANDFKRDKKNRIIILEKEF